MDSAREGEAVAGESDGYGDRYTVDVDVIHGGCKATVRSARILLRGEFVLLD